MATRTETLDFDVQVEYKKSQILFLVEVLKNTGSLSKLNATDKKLIQDIFKNTLQGQEENKGFLLNHILSSVIKNRYLKQRSSNYAEPEKERKKYKKLEENTLKIIGELQSLDKFTLQQLVSHPDWKENPIRYDLNFDYTFNLLLDWINNSFPGQEPQLKKSILLTSNLGTSYRDESLPLIFFDEKQTDRLKKNLALNEDEEALIVSYILKTRFDTISDETTKDFIEDGVKNIHYLSGNLERKYQIINQCLRQADIINTDFSVIKIGPMIQRFKTYFEKLNKLNPEKVELEQTVNFFVSYTLQLQYVALNHFKNEKEASEIKQLPKKLEAKQKEEEELLKILALVSTDPAKALVRCKEVALENKSYVSQVIQDFRLKQSSASLRKEFMLASNDPELGISLIKNHNFKLSDSSTKDILLEKEFLKLSLLFSSNPNLAAAPKKPLLKI